MRGSGNTSGSNGRGHVHDGSRSCRANRRILPRNDDAEVDHEHQVRTRRAEDQLVVPTDWSPLKERQSAIEEIRQSNWQTPAISDSKASQMEHFRVHPEGARLTSDQGVPIPDTDDTLRAGLRAPSLIEDVHMREKITRFDHERIPERASGFRTGRFRLERRNDTPTPTQRTRYAVRTVRFLRFLSRAGPMDTSRTGEISTALVKRSPRLVAIEGAVRLGPSIDAAPPRIDSLDIGPLRINSLNPTLPALQDSRHARTRLPSHDLNGQRRMSR